MERLKAFDKIMEPDERQKHFSVQDRQSIGYRPKTLQDIYENVVSINLHEDVPEEIRTHFVTAQNLLIYSWFFYPFNVTAQLMAFITLEFALKKKFKPDRRMPFSKLVKIAVDKRLVKDECFSHTKWHIGEDIIFEEGDTPIPRQVRSYYFKAIQQQMQNYMDALSINIPELRNELAHGSQMLHSQGATWVRICAEFINQLYQESGRKV